jgi:hypothetical protein
MYVCNLFLTAADVKEPCKLGASMYVHGGGLMGHPWRFAPVPPSGG